MMANISMADTLILMVLALVVFGPRRLPLIGRQIGKLMYEFRKASNDFKFQMEEELRQAEEADRRKKEEEERKRAMAAAPQPAQIAPPAEAPIQTSEPAAPAPPPEPPAEIAADIPDVSTSTIDPAVESPIESPAGAPFVGQQPSSSLGTSEERTPDPAFDPPHPRIAPPATGEKVPAAYPAGHAEQRNLFAEDPGKSSEPAAPEAERSEPATHHG
jgi:sec-independent protein translocase protein TatB